MALLVTQQIGVTGSTISHDPAALSDTVKYDGRTFLWYKNSNASPRDITVVVPGSRLGQANPDVPITLPATNGEKLVALAREEVDPATGLVTVNLSATPGVTVAAVRL